MSHRKHLARLVLAGGALASIATSRIEPTWTLIEEQPLGLLGVVLDDEVPSQRLALAGTLHTRSEDDRFAIGGSVQVTIELRAIAVSGVRAAEVEVVFASELDPGKSVRLTERVDPGRTVTRTLSFDAWNGCDRNQCLEDYLLTLRRLNDSDDVAVELAGVATITAIGTNDDVPPDGAALELEVTDLGPLP